MKYVRIGTLDCGGFYDEEDQQDIFYANASIGSLHLLYNFTPTCTYTGWRNLFITTKFIAINTGV